MIFIERRGNKFYTLDNEGNPTRPVYDSFEQVETFMDSCPDGVWVSKTDQREPRPESHRQKMERLTTPGPNTREVDRQRAYYHTPQARDERYRRKRRELNKKTRVTI